MMTRSQRAQVLPILLLLISLMILLLTAWVSDDAFITLRTVDNWAHGYGPTWNISERVQTYTHPLWMLLLASLYPFIPNGYFTAVVLSVATSLIVQIIFLYNYRHDVFAMLFGWAILILSKAFVDYSTSGLENPLTHLLILLFAIEFLRSEFPVPARKFQILALLAGFSVLNRMDTLLFFAPALIYLFLFQHRNWRGVVILATAFLPFIFWELFSVFYYGFLFPNTAYAKLNAGVSHIALLHQGVLYFINSLRLDPITLITTASALCLTVLYRGRKELLLASGICLYLVYILYIGGDFMSGRFFSAVVLLSVVLLLQRAKDFSPRGKYSMAAIVLILGVLPLIVTSLRSQPAQERTSGVLDPSSGIADERLFYLPSNQLIHALENMPMPDHPWAEIGKQYRKQGPAVKVEGAIGMLGYFAGPQVHIVDIWAICDPLLSRIKIRDSNWRIGHYPRPIVDGYIETLQTGENHIQDPQLAQYYEKLKIIISGDLWSWDRIKVIWKMNTGQYDDLLPAYQD